MAKQTSKPLPPRKEPGLISGVISAFFGALFWIALSLFLSIVIEWFGIAFVWPEEREQHAMHMLTTEVRYLNDHMINLGSELDQSVYRLTKRVTDWVEHDSGFYKVIEWMRSPLRIKEGLLSQWGYSLYENYEPYLLAIPTITKLFFVRVTIIILSLPAFVLFALVGMVDGLVERLLRRWGGGRESSNVYNLARKSIFPLFVLSCVLYVSSPVTVHPAWIIMPFAAAFGLSIRVTFSRLKKYF